MKKKPLTKEDLSPEARKLYEQLEEDLRAALCESFVGKPNDEKNRKIMRNLCVEYIEVTGHLDLED